ncbi:sodium:proton antiporter [Tropicimonas isoalkanivorans]|uniref:Possible tyrosine transporter P-protein (TC 2.A.45.2.1) n=1 Tax=Tropicimonas isoalkanivorans TaxID=441112 RepID=A0A1I1PRZ5_9RHOB|nr:ArsB/NhaD family transporter [Tropicimonas isoalkanivorans]SFD10378.1 possible tyrosine transporter P-protein (TC 2.A.45.2.1) [Tropicimonas isoalkanivorans]
MDHSSPHGEAALSIPDLLGIDPLWVATGILILVYVALISEKVNRAILAMLGAALMVVFGIINQEQAVSGVDANTLALLIGMMMIVSITSKSGLFQYAAIKAAKSVNAKPMGILVMLTLITAVFSALLDNVTTVLLIAPITLLITDELKTRVFPFFMAEILASNIGGTATLIGDPPNIIIGSAANLSFNDFLMNLAPIATVCLVVMLGVTILLNRRALSHIPPEASLRIMKFKENEAITDRRLMVKSLGVLALVLLGFTVGHGYGLMPGTSALAGAALLMLLAFGHQKSEKQSDSLHGIFAEVEWVTIFFFGGLFVVVAGVEHAGLLEIFATKILDLTQGDLMKTSFLIFWASGILSAILDNIPFVATMIPMIESTAHTFGGAEAIEPLWWSLALGACLGGNGTLLGASANLTVAAFAEKAKQPIGFVDFVKIGFPVTMLMLAISNVYIWMRYF